MKMLKILIILLIIIIIILVIGFFFVGNYFYNIALNPKSSKTFVLGEIADDSEEAKLSNHKQIENQNWLHTYSKDTYITSNDGLKLHAYQIENQAQSNIWAIVVHGYMSKGSDMISSSKKFYEMGYNVLILDLRGHGKSEGDYIGMGWDDRLDVIKWSDYIISKNENSKIILYGVSMGAATVMMTTGEELKDNIKIAIEDCGYTSIWDEFAGQLNQLFNLPTFPALNAADVVTKIRSGYSLKDGSAVEQVAKSNTPTLFIHGDEDTFVPFWMLDRVYDSANCEKQRLAIEGAKHAESFTVNPELYWNTIKEFINKYI